MGVLPWFTSQRTSVCLTVRAVACANIWQTNFVLLVLGSKRQLGQVLLLETIAGTNWH